MRPKPQSSSPPRKQAWELLAVEPDPRLEQLRRLDEWLSHLTVWQQHLLTVPFALVIAGITVWLNSVLPPVHPNLVFLARPFGPLP